VMIEAKASGVWQHQSRRGYSNHEPRQDECTVSSITDKADAETFAHGRVILLRRSARLSGFTLEGFPGRPPIFGNTNTRQLNHGHSTFRLDA
jgi:hypothetical protein